MTRTKTFTFAVEVSVPEEATEAETKEFVLEAVSAWPGQCRPPGAYGDDDPGDPMRDLGVVSIRNMARMKQRPHDPRAKPGAGRTAVDRPSYR